MDAPQQKKDFAWQPMTPRGISKFSRAPLGRLWLVQFVVALAFGGVVIWFLHADWFPIISRAIKAFPRHAEIRSGKLDWTADPAIVLAENRFLAVSVDLKHAGAARSPAHVGIELGSLDCKVFSLLGYLQWRYPRDWIISLGRDEAVSWWGAWSPAILALVAGGVAGIMMVFWTLLATLYFAPIWLLAFFANRELTLGGSWRLSGAALMPSTIFLSAATFGYGLGWFGLVGLALAAVAHLVVGWIYLGAGVFSLRPISEAAGTVRNPFAAPPPPPAPPSASADQPPPAAG